MHSPDAEWRKPDVGQWTNYLVHRSQVDRVKNQTRITSPVYLIEPQSELAERAKYFSPGVVTYKSENLSGFLKKKKKFPSERCSYLWGHLRIIIPPSSERLPFVWKKKSYKEIVASEWRLTVQTCWMDRSTCLNRITACSQSSRFNTRHKQEEYWTPAIKQCGSTLPPAVTLMGMGMTFYTRGCKVIQPHWLIHPITCLFKLVSVSVYKTPIHTAGFIQCCMLLLIFSQHHSSITHLTTITVVKTLGVFLVYFPVEICHCAFLQGHGIQNPPFFSLTVFFPLPCMMLQ